MRVLRTAALVAALLVGAVAPAQASETYWTTGDVTQYCSAGYMADGNYTYEGAAAGAYWIPIGSLVYVPGHGTVTIEDRGQPGLFVVDIFTWDCSEAWDWGRQYQDVQVLRWGWDG